MKRHPVTSNRLFGVNSEGDIFKECECRRGSWSPPSASESDHPAIPAMMRLWGRFMERFRNWPSTRRCGGSFSDTTARDERGKLTSFGCVMPCGYVDKSGTPRAWLQIEYSARGDMLTGRDGGYPRAEVRVTVQTLATVLQEQFPDLLVFANEETNYHGYGCTGYFTVNLCGGEADYDSLYEAAIRAVEITRGDEVLWASSQRPSPPESVAGA